APLNTVPPTQTTAQATPKTFSSANGNAITVSDLEASSVQVTLSVGNGTLTLGTQTGISITGGADGSASVTILGPIGAVNTAMNGLIYSPAAAFSGNDALTITTSDLG